jgi:hypothetical protein
MARTQCMETHLNAQRPEAPEPEARGTRHGGPEARSGLAAPAHAHADWRRPCPCPDCTRTCTQVDGSAADWEEVLLWLYPRSEQRKLTAELAYRVRALVISDLAGLASLATRSFRRALFVHLPLYACLSHVCCLPVPT